MTTTQTKTIGVQILRIVRYIVMEEYKMKYTQEIKDKAVEAAKAGTSLKEIQQTIGPNPKATQRYLKAAGIDYKELRAELKEKGIAKPSVNRQDKNASAKAKETKKGKASQAPTTEVIDE